jgi:hypothetical protein
MNVGRATDPAVAQVPEPAALVVGNRNLGRVCRQRLAAVILADEVSP